MAEIVAVVVVDAAALFRWRMLDGTNLQSHFPFECGRSFRRSSRHSKHIWMPLKEEQV